MKAVIFITNQTSRIDVKMSNHWSDRIAKVKFCKASYQLSGTKFELRLFDSKSHLIDFWHLKRSCCGSGFILEDNKSLKIAIVDQSVCACPSTADVSIWEAVSGSFLIKSLGKGSRRKNFFRNI